MLLNHYRDLLLAMSLSLTTALSWADYSQHPRAQRLINELTTEHGFSAEYLRAALRGAQRNPKLIQAEQQSAEKTRTWPDYLSIFLEPARVAAGVDFWAAHAQPLEQAATYYGVPAEIIVAILGVETRYGGYTGPHRVLDSLATQGFEHPTRQAFFYNELKEFFLLCREQNWAPGDPKGSYAGALGWAQFMPSNYRRLAVDFDRDGLTDLWDPVDAIGSIARYLRDFRGPGRGWQPELPVLVAALGDAPPDWPVNSTRPHAEYAQISRFVTAIPGLPASTRVGLLELSAGAQNERWLATDNFYALMAYNPRVFYATAVYRLSRAIADRYRQPQP